MENTRIEDARVRVISMSDLDFSHCNIAMATHESTGRTIVWDRDTDTFGSGFDLPEALNDLAENYSEKYRGNIQPDYACPECGNYSALTVSYQREKVVKCPECGYNN